MLAVERVVGTATACRWGKVALLRLTRREVHRINAQNDGVGSIAVLATELSYLVL